MRNILLASTAVIHAMAFMSFEDIIPTVYIKTDAGPVRINASDYDASKHELVDPSELPALSAIPEAAQQQEPVADASGIRDTPQPAAGLDANGQPIGTDGSGEQGAPSGEAAGENAGDGEPSEVVEHSSVSNQRGVIKTGSKFFVTDMAGVKIEAEGIDPNGYKDEGAAWAAVVAAPVA